MVKAQGPKCGVILARTSSLPAPDGAASAVERPIPLRPPGLGLGMREVESGCGGVVVWWCVRGKTPKPKKKTKKKNPKPGGPEWVKNRLAPRPSRGLGFFDPMPGHLTKIAQAATGIGDGHGLVFRRNVRANHTCRFLHGLTIKVGPGRVRASFNENAGLKTLVICDQQLDGTRSRSFHAVC